MRAGTLRKRVTIEQPSEGSQDALGEKPVTWSRVTDVWAAVLPQGGREFYRGQQVIAELTHVVSVRHRGDVTIDETMRVNLGGRYLHIASVQNVEERDRELLLFCIEQK